VHHQYQRHRWKICHRCQHHRRQILSLVPLLLSIPVANLPLMSIILAANVKDTDSKLPAVSYGILSGFGELIHEKNLKLKISWYCPFNYLMANATIFYFVIFFKLLLIRAHYPYICLLWSCMLWTESGLEVCFSFGVVLRNCV
jgi:hypothetical protein